MAEKIDELARVEFSGRLGESFLDYSRALEELARRWKYELEVAAGDAEAAMSALRGHPLLFGIDTRLKARQVAKRVKRMQELAHGIQDAGRKFHRSYRTHFLEAAEEDGPDDDLEDE